MTLKTYRVTAYKTMSVSALVDAHDAQEAQSNYVLKRGGYRKEVTGVLDGSDPTAHLVADEPTWEKICQDTLAEAISLLDDNINLLYVDHDDQLYGDQIDAYLRGDYEQLYESMDSWMSDQRCYYAAEAIETIRDQLARRIDDPDIGTDDADMDAFDEVRGDLRDTIYDRDISDPIAQLAGTTPTMLLRYRLGQPGLSLDGQGVFGDVGVNDEQICQERFTARKTALGAILANYGVDLDVEVNSTALDTIIDNGPWDWHEGVVADLLWYGSIVDAAASIHHGIELTITDPYLLVIDQMNGSCHMERLQAAITVPVEANDDEYSTEKVVYCDETLSDYASADKICGLYKPAFAADVERHTVVTEDVA